MNVVIRDGAAFLHDNVSNKLKALNFSLLSKLKKSFKFKTSAIYLDNVAHKN